MEAIFNPRAEKLGCQSELSDTLELTITLPTDQNTNREDELSHSEHTVHKTVTVPATNYFYRDYMRAEGKILKGQVIFTKDKCSMKAHMEYGQHHSMATTAPDDKLCVSKRSFSMNH